jgi:hypothetical protein
MTHHSEAINHIIEKYGFTSYLEIGVCNPTKNFDLIKCKFKIGIDPEPSAKANFLGTSDEFFIQNLGYFGCIFIDGLHWDDQVVRDFDSSTECLGAGGIILIHDTDPKKEEYACYPRNGLRGRWNGNVFKALPAISGGYWDWRSPDFDANGLTVVKSCKERQKLLDPVKDYQDFLNRRAELLRPCTTKEFLEWI